jgi:uncharacterized protein YggT (Ycf19 family)|uniref:YggT family protein n=2 Tax=Pelagomonas TaxID=35676 RepID=A0A7S3ZJ29_9STRA|nr:conserved hypothetical integral membrane protein [uncultured Pelagomonas]|tara:strand:+ start:46027 stop:46446 length:420 start_codon:yes stop_codon:yes gene_type:complete|mmetsp:Transcript_21098/g.64987  ORF Transcript_21098/g.64987 Transcript_21098/m.64987 type:complete len:140 (+) Transcript_21098:276-695(+)
MEAYSTLLLTSGPAIQHILENGNVVDLPGDVTFICEVSNPAMANSLGTVKFALIDLIRIFGFFYVLRFTIQFFGHINPYDGGLFETIYTFTEPYTRLFLGFLPSLYNMDMGLILGFIILDRIETLISKIAILDLAGTIY